MTTPRSLLLIVAASLASVASAQYYGYGSGYGSYRSGSSSSYSSTTTRHQHNFDGSTTTYRNTYRYRGADGASVLFKNEKFASEFPEADWVDAVAERNAPVMLNLAWLLDGIEKRLGAKDEKTSSATLYDATGRMAVAQRNAAALDQLVRLWPTGKKYQEEAKALGGTRGGKELPPVALPQIVAPTPDKEGKLAAAKPGTCLLYTSPSPRD